MTVKPLAAKSLFTRTDLTSRDIQSTDDLEDIEALIGQQRALGAVRFAASMQQRGYNLFVIGPKGSGRHMAVKRFLEERGGELDAPPDWVYVHNFDKPYSPKAIAVPAGRGEPFRRAMLELVSDLKAVIPTLFESEDYRLRTDAVNKTAAEKQQHALEGVDKEARKHGLTLIRTPQGFAFAPLSGKKPMAPETFQQLPEEAKKRYQDATKSMMEELQKVLHGLPMIERDRLRALRKIARETARHVIDQEISDVEKVMTSCDAVLSYLKTVADDMVEHIGLFMHSEEEGPLALPNGGGESAVESDPSTRYQVNVLVANRPTDGAPVIIEDHPALSKLVGRIEHYARMGTLITDFTLIKPGALHQANGGFLLINADKLLLNPMSWEALKRALYAGQITIESPYMTSATATVVSLQPDPVPLDLKIVLFGDYRLYLLLSSLDPDFQDLFKVAADFEEVLERTPENDQLFARLVATIARNNKLRPFARDAIERVMEHAARIAGDAERVSTRVGLIADLMREADHWAGEVKAKSVARTHVQEAIDAQIHRADRVRERSIEQITRGTVLIDTDGAKVGQVNGLSVLQIGSFAFGKPSRISATVRTGAGKVVDIEREVELGGPLHSKGVMILSGYLARTYAPDAPMSLAATLTFEQSYGGVDGDSASSAELYALLSALSEVPVDQSLAVTGSVNQMGEVQAIGGANEKIEGFFDVCAARGLTGRQGVLIPASNVKHLMLRDDVVQACKEKKFRILPIRTIEEGIETLTGKKAGARGADGKYPSGSINRLVEDRLVAFAKARFKAAAKAKTGQ
ncbi:AAA family ATPase [Nisaea acidiphila]|uniref:endopeptidase La n=1 Tax=Nisaea acidiphila TaxID=1862145 RepID=A0A9J7B2N9_9PROT|nr:ATP-binding protein [Nisaea acidiphila]UUX51917.1 AAA family ATPase [Nisaea acidiphila]